MNLFPKVLANSTVHSSSHSTLLHLYQYLTSLFCLMLFLSFGVTSMCFQCFASFEMYLYTIFLHMFLILSHRAGVYGMTVTPVLVGRFWMVVCLAFFVCSFCSAFCLVPTWVCAPQ